MKLRLVRASAGVAWVQQGVRTFWRQPMALAALFFMVMASMSLITLVPVVGSALALALLPAAQLSMMVASAEALQGRFPQVTLLLVAFRSGAQRTQSMLVLGACYAGGFLAIMGLSALVDGGIFARVYLTGAPLTAEVAQSGAFQAAMWLALALYLPLSLLFWHAPGLVHWHGVPPLKALFFSAVACLRNFWAFTLFGIAWVGVFLVGGLVVALVTGLLSLIMGSAGAGIMVGAAMMLAAMFFCSIVFSFRDCFEPPEEQDLPPEPAPPSA